MLISDLLQSGSIYPSDNQERHQYVKELVLEVARLGSNETELTRLNGKQCWPCRTPTGLPIFCSVGNFYVNDRQNLFDIFSGYHTFLDFDFEVIKKIAGLLRTRGCYSFLSNTVLAKTEACEPLEFDNNFTQSFRNRANALVMYTILLSNLLHALCAYIHRYFEHSGQVPSHDSRHLLANAEAWRSTDIRTQYTLGSITFTRNEGGSSAKISNTADGTSKLELYVSADRQTRDCALITDFPKQIAEVLKLDPTRLPDLHSLLQVPLASLNALLIRKGITGNNDDAARAEALVPNSIQQDSPGYNAGTSHNDSHTTLVASASLGHASSTASVVAGSSRASATSVARDTSLRPHAGHRLQSQQNTAGARGQPHQSTPFNGVLSERPVTPQLTVSGVYSANNRIWNRERLQDFARSTNLASSPYDGASSSQLRGNDGTFDMGALRQALGDPGPAIVSTPVQNNSSGSRRVRPSLNRNEEEMARDFEVGFLGEQFVSLQDLVGSIQTHRS